MDVGRLRSFLVLADELHFGRAAARLGIAQPHLSRRIQELERTTGARLFQRTQRQVELTPAGQAFAERVRSVLSSLDEAVAHARNVADGTGGRLRVGFIHSSTYALLPAILRSVRALRPGLAFDLREMTILAQVAALRVGEIDLGILRPLADMEGLAAETIFREPFRVAVPEDHALARRRRVRLAEIAREPFIMFPRETSPLFNARISAAFAAIGALPDVVQEATQIHTVLGLVRAGLGMALVPASAAGLAAPGIRLLDVEHAPDPVEVCVAWRADRGLPACHAFLAAAKQVIAASDPQQPSRRPKSARDSSSCRKVASVQSGS